MKRNLVSLCISFLCCTLAVAQDADDESTKGRVGLSYSTFGENDIIRFDELIGGPGWIGKSHFSIGLNYLFPLTRHLELETGMEYSWHELIKRPNVDPTIDILLSTEELSIWVVPVTLRYTFLKYFFLNGGALLDFDSGVSNSIDSQTGIGATFGPGVNYEFRCGCSVWLSPYLKMHSLIPFSGEKNSQHLMESGIRFGIAWRLR